MTLCFKKSREQHLEIVLETMNWSIVEKLNYHWPHQVYNFEYLTNRYTE